jgi:hypothetical protein
MTKHARIPKTSGTATKAKQSLGYHKPAKKSPPTVVPRTRANRGWGQLTPGWLEKV